MQGPQNTLGHRFAHGQKLAEIVLDLGRMKLLVLAPSSLDTIALNVVALSRAADLAKLKCMNAFASTASQPFAFGLRAAHAES
jgi:hypothetical protein